MDQPRLSLAERLRITGQWLDSQDAQSAEVRIDGGGVEIHAIDCSGLTREQHFSEADLQELSATAHQNRRNPFGSMTGRWALSLRTLGQDVESRGIELLLVRTLAGGLQVYGMRHESEVSQWYAFQRLSDWDRVHRADRAIKQLRAVTVQLEETGAWRQYVGRAWQVAAVAVVAVVTAATLFGIGGRESLSASDTDRAADRFVRVPAERSAGRPAADPGAGPCRGIVELLDRPAECSRTR